MVESIRVSKNAGAETKEYPCRGRSKLDSRNVEKGK
jgi:hypothetical protein